MRLASILPSFPFSPFIVFLHSSRGMQSKHREPWTEQEVNGNWLNQTFSASLILLGEGSRLAGGSMVVRFPFCQHCSLRWESLFYTLLLQVLKKYEGSCGFTITSSLACYCALGCFFANTKFNHMLPRWGRCLSKKFYNIMYNAICKYI